MRRTTVVTVAALALVGSACAAPVQVAPTSPDGVPGAVGAISAGGSARPASLGAPSRATTAEVASDARLAAATTPQRPNVMVIETDDMRTDDLRFMPRTKKLIGDRGLTFENSFAPYPLCCPSRSSFLTGRYAHNHQVLSHEEPFGFASFDDRATLATVLKKAGYRTALLGKYLNGYGQQRLRRPAARAGDSSLRYVPPGWTHWAAGSDHHWRKGDPFRGSTYNYFNLVQNVNGRIVGTRNTYSTDVLGAQTRALTDRWRTGSPWFVWWNPVAPHHGGPSEPDDPQPTRASNGTVTRWQTAARPAWVKGRFDNVVPRGAGIPAQGSPEADVSDKPSYLRSPDLNAAERRAVAEVTRQRAEALYVLDVQVGKTLERLRTTGQLARTIVVFTSDNGYYLGEHRRRQGKITAHEPSLRVPLLIAGPGVPRGQRFDPALTVDLGPTIASYAGTRLPRPDGVDLRPTITGGDRGWTRAVVTEGRIGGGYQRGPWTGETAEVQRQALSSRGIRLGRWKLTRYSTGERELYDLVADPLELQNLAKDPASAGVLRELTVLHRAYMACDEDACRVPVPEPFAVGPERNREITLAQARATEAYYR